jgi:site-specific recombinase XerD
MADAKCATMQSLNDSVHAFLNHCQFERNFSDHTVKAHRLDLSQLNRFALQRSKSNGVREVDRSLIREYTRTLQPLQTANPVAKAGGTQVVVRFSRTRWSRRIELREESSARHSPWPDSTANG